MSSFWRIPTSVSTLSYSSTGGRRFTSDLSYSIVKSAPTDFYRVTDMTCVHDAPSLSAYLRCLFPFKFQLRPNLPRYLERASESPVFLVDVTTKWAFCWSLALPLVCWCCTTILCRGEWSFPRTYFILLCRHFGLTRAVGTVSCEIFKIKSAYEIQIPCKVKDVTLHSQFKNIRMDLQSQPWVILWLWTGWHFLDIKQCSARLHKFLHTKKCTNHVASVHG